MSKKNLLSVIAFTIVIASVSAQSPVNGFMQWSTLIIKNRTNLW